MGGASRALRKPVAPAATADDEVAAVVGHVTVTSRDLRRQQTPPARVDDDTDRRADEHQQQQQRRQEQRRCRHHRHHDHQQHRRNDDDEPAACSTSEEDDSSVFADTLTSPQSVYSDARDEPDDDGTAIITDMVVNSGEMIGGSAGRTAAAAAATRQAFTIVKHRKVELNPTKIQSTVANGKSVFLFTRSVFIYTYTGRRF